jgi:hypothetical protein
VPIRRARHPEGTVSGKIGKLELAEPPVKPFADEPADFAIAGRAQSELRQRPLQEIYSRIVCHSARLKAQQCGAPACGRTATQKFVPLKNFEELVSLLSSPAFSMDPNQSNRDAGPNKFLY